MGNVALLSDVNIKGVHAGLLSAIKLGVMVTCRHMSNNLHVSMAIYGLLTVMHFLLEIIAICG